jgi:hypothetical protein
VALRRQRQMCIRDSMLADKLTDGYNLRKIDTAIKLEQQNANPEN